MRRRTSCNIIKKDFKQDTKTELTENSEDQEISLDINKNIFDSNENPFDSENTNSSSQSSEYQEIQTRRGQVKGKRSMKKEKKEALKRKQSKSKKVQHQNSSKCKITQSENLQIISKRYSDLFFSEQSSKDQIQEKNVKKPKKRQSNPFKITIGNNKEDETKNYEQVGKLQKDLDFWKKLKSNEKKEQKIKLEQKDLQKFISENGDLHITDYEFSDEGQILGQFNTCKMRYIFQPKYQVKDVKKNDRAIRIGLTSEEIAQNHDLFIELIRFYRNMWEDHGIIAKMFV